MGVNDSSPRAEAFQDYLRASEELAQLMRDSGIDPDGPFICGEHERFEPCRPCLRREGFYDE